MRKQIFDERGFLTPEGKLFVNDNFTKELKRIFDTADTLNDVSIISCILKSVVDDYAGLLKVKDYANPVKSEQTKDTGSTKINKDVIPGTVIQLSKHRKSLNKEKFIPPDDVS